MRGLTETEYADLLAFEARAGASTSCSARCLQMDAIATGPALVSRGLLARTRTCAVIDGAVHARPTDLGRLAVRT